jgi:hypothetical protein
MVLSLNQASSNQAKITVQVRFQRQQAALKVASEQHEPQMAMTRSVWDWVKIRRALALVCSVTMVGSLAWFFWPRAASHDSATAPRLPTSEAPLAAPSVAPSSSVTSLAAPSAPASAVSSAPITTPQVSQAMTESTVVTDADINADEVPHDVEPVATEQAAMIQRSEAQIPAIVIESDSSAAPQQGFRRVVLTASMERLEPGSELGERITGDIARLYFFTEVEGFAGQLLKHRWFYQQQLQTEATLTIEDTPWRTYSEKWLPAEQRGAWTIEVVDAQDKVLLRRDFYYQ